MCGSRCLLGNFQIIRLEFTLFNLLIPRSFETNIKTARNNLLLIHDTFRRKWWNSDYRSDTTIGVCISIIMRPSGYFISPHVPLGATWVWDHCCKASTKLLTKSNFKYLFIFIPHASSTHFVSNCSFMLSLDEFVEISSNT